MFNEEFNYKFCMELLRKGEIEIISYEYGHEKGSPTVYYYGDGTGDPGEPSYNEAYAKFSVVCDINKLDTLKGLNQKELRNYIEEEFKNITVDLFEEYFGVPLEELIGGCGELPSEIDEKEIEYVGIGENCGLIVLSFEAWIYGDTEWP